MERAVRYALIAVLCWLGLAQAYILWGPRSYVANPGETPDGLTGCNNTWAVTGCGNTVDVAYVKDGHVCFRQSFDGGASWHPTPAYPLDGGVASSSSNPSLVKLDEGAVDLIAVFWTSTSYSGHGRPEVWCRGSTDGGAHWGDALPAVGKSEDQLDKDTMYGYLPSASARPALQAHVTDRNIRVVWQEAPGAGAESIGANGIHFEQPIDDDVHWQLDCNMMQYPDPGFDQHPGAPSVWENNSVDMPYGGCAWQLPPDGIFTNYRDGGWSDNCVGVGGSFGDVGYPSIACVDSVALINGGETIPEHEAVAFEATRNDTEGIGVAFRSWDRSSGVWAPRAGWVSVLAPHSGQYPFWPELSGFELHRPSLSAQSVNGQLGDTFVIAFTVYATGGGGPRGIIYSTVYNDHTNPEGNPDNGWYADYPRTLAFSADSVCVSISRDHVYALFQSIEWPHLCSPGAAVRVGTFKIGPPVVSLGAVAERPNSGRQLARAPGSSVIQRAYAVDNFINYERSTDNGATWDYQDAPDFGEYPTIALDAGGNPWIAYVRADSTGSNDTLYAAVRNADSGWTRVALYGAASNQHLGAPSLGVFQAGSGRCGNACFPVYSQTAHSKVIYCQFDTCGNVEQNVVDDFNGSYADSTCCLVVSTDTEELVYQRGDSVFMRRQRYSPSNNTPPPDSWPQRSLVSAAAGPVHRHPFCQKIGARLWVTYSQHYYDAGTGDSCWVIKKASCCDTAATIVWEGTTDVSSVNNYPTDYPCLSNNVVSWAESSGTTNHWVIKASVNDSILTLTNPDSTSKFVSILADTSVQTTPSTSTTGVYYLWLQQLSSASDTYSVNYASKQVLTSNADANVTRYNQGCKLVRSTDAGGDSLACVYRTSQGSIDFSTKKDGEEGWATSMLRSTGEYPCLADDYANRTWVAEHDVTSVPPCQVIRCQNRAAGSNSWHDFQVYSVPSGGSAKAKIGPPAIAACPNDSSGQNTTSAYVVFTVYTSVPVKSTIVLCKVCTTGVVYVDTLHSVTSYADSFPTIALCPVAGPGFDLDVAFQSGTEIYTKKTNADHPEFLTKRIWSGNYNLSNTLTSSRHPYMAAGETLLVAWVEGDSGRILTRGQSPGSAYDSWDDTVNVSLCPDTVADYPSIALGDSNIVEFQKKLSPSNFDIIARVNFAHSLNISNTSTASTYPHCLFHEHDGTTPVISTVWTEALSTNYAEVGYRRWELNVQGGGGTQSASVFDPSIRPALFAPSPNPFNHTTSIRFQTNIGGRTSVAIHDVTGRRVANLMNAYQRPGVYNVTWTGRDDRQRQLPGGIYFVRLQTPNYSESKKLILME